MKKQTFGRIRKMGEASRPMRDALADHCLMYQKNLVGGWEPTTLSWTYRIGATDIHIEMIGPVAHVRRTQDFVPIKERTQAVKTTTVRGLKRALNKMLKEI